MKWKEIAHSYCGIMKTAYCMKHASTRFFSKEGGRGNKLNIDQHTKFHNLRKALIKYKTFNTVKNLKFRKTNKLRILKTRGRVEAWYEYSILYEHIILYEHSILYQRSILYRQKFFYPLNKTAILFSRLLVSL